MCGEMNGFFIITEASKEASTVLCPVVKHAGNGRGPKKWKGGSTRRSRVFLPTTVEASSFVNY